MLSRTADNLYWMARYMERAENMARILEVGDRMAMLPDPTGDSHRSEWHSALAISGAEDLFNEKDLEPEARTIIEFIGHNPDNPSSIYSCVRTARDNARAVRNSLTSEMWESLNATWLDLEGQWRAAESSGEWRPFLEWMKDRSSLFRGVLFGTMMRDPGFNFTRLGTFIERADNTARILDVKYHVLLPKDAQVGGSVDYYQWTTVLRAVSALSIYRRLYHETPQPWNIAELLILREELPRSLISCVREMTEQLESLAQAYGRRLECHRVAGKLYAELKFARSRDIYQGGLHEFLSDFIIRNNQLSDEIARCYLFLD
jgi:uncharacterized alpha-E superfamily protein